MSISRLHSRISFYLVLFISFALLPLTDSARGDDEANDEGFTAIFNGKDLTDWSGDPKFWKVEEGLIIGETTAETPTQGNTFLIWQKEQPGDFELRFKYRCHSGNSGVQYRSKDHGDWRVGGYQADIDAGNNFTGILYDERGRGILATRGQEVKIHPDGRKEVTGSTGDDADIVAAVKQGEWNDYIIRCEGRRLIQIINGKTTVDVTDNQDGAGADSGVIALQLHAGPPMRVEFKDLRIKMLK